MEIKTSINLGYKTIGGIKMLPPLIWQHSFWRGYYLDYAWKPTGKPEEYGLTKF